MLLHDAIRKLIESNRMKKYLRSLELLEFRNEFRKIKLSEVIDSMIYILNEANEVDNTNVLDKETKNRDMHVMNMMIELIA